MALRDRLAALLGISAFTKPPPTSAPSLGSRQVNQTREQQGGQLTPLPVTRTRWYPADLESAEVSANTGDLSLAAQLMAAARRDGIYSGVLETRTGGLVRLPKRFRGMQEAVKELELGHNETASVFDQMHPAAELALLAADGLELGVGVAELLPVEGRIHPIMIRLDPQFLWYVWSENRWYYRSTTGFLPITPGDGQWVLHIPGGRVSPWMTGIWRAVGRAYIRKDHAGMYRDNWEAKLANPARIAIAPAAAPDTQRADWARKLMAWGVNSVFGLLPGWDVKLLESNGRGAESFRNTIQEQNEEFVVVVAGQTVTTDGGAGFANADIHKSIRADLIKSTADGLAHTLNTQTLPSWLVDRFGEEALDEGIAVEWDVTPAKDREAEARALGTTAQAIAQLTEALRLHGKELDVDEVASRFGVPISTARATGAPDLRVIEGGATGDEKKIAAALELAEQLGLRPTEATVRSLARKVGLDLEVAPVEDQKAVPIELAPTDVAKVVRAREARASIKLPPFGDDRDEKTITQLGAAATEQAGAIADIEVAEAEEDLDEGQEAA